MEQLVQLPPELKALIGLVVTLFVTQVLKWVAGKFGIDLSGYSARIVAALVASVLALVDASLASIPAEFAPIANAVLGLLVVIVGSYGLYDLLLRKK